MARDKATGRRRSGPPFLVWFDLEFTTLEFDRAHLLQAAMVLTDSRLRRLGPPDDDVRAVVRLPPRARVSPWVRLHLAPLVRAARSPAALPVPELDRLLAGRIDRRAGPPNPDIEKRPVLAGNSVHADWTLARRLLPAFSARLHYRHLDVTTLKLHGDWTPGLAEFPKQDPAWVRRWFPGAVLHAGAGEHDAHYDAQASIAELAYYRARLLRRAGRLTAIASGPASGSGSPRKRAARGSGPSRRGPRSSGRP